MSEELVNITIDGHPLSVPKGTLLVEAARQIGLEIPVYCYHPKMKPVGACRVCVVEVENQRRPIMTACTTTVMPDMVVHTQSENAIAAREGILEFLLINHPLDCPVCDRAGECDLQDFTIRYGPQTSRFIEQKRHFEKSKQVGENVILDRERCIMCQRCVRFCDEIAMEEGLVIIERGNRSEIGTFEGRSFDSKFSGNVIELCPVGALTAKTYRFESRPWEQQHYACLCNVSSLGVNITADVRYDKVVRIRSRINESIDDGWLWDKCRYSHLPIHDESRLLTPQVRNAQGELEEASWSQALSRISSELDKDDLKSAVLVGSRLSCEDASAALRLARGVMESPRVAHEYSHEALISEVPLQGRVVGCDKADAIILVGCDPAESHPDFELRIKKGLQAGAKLISLGAEGAMAGYVDHEAVGEPAELWEKLKKAVKKKSKSKDEELKRPSPRPWEAGGETKTVWKHLVEELKSAEKVLVVVAGDLKAAKLTNLPADVEALGWSSEPYGLLHLRSGVNSMGHELIGLRPMDWEDEAVERYENAWDSFNRKTSEDYRELATTEHDVLLSLGGDPASLEDWFQPKFLVALNTHPNATTEKADVILPLASWLESNGVFVSTEGTIQFSRQAILPLGESKPAHLVCQLIAQELEGEEAPLLTSRQLYQELGTLNSYFAGASYADFKKKGVRHWSYPQQADLGMPRPDLSAIPVEDPGAPMWMPAVATGSSVENCARIHRGETPPAVPGQRDPREIAALLGLSKRFKDEAPALPASTVEPKEGYISLRVLPSSAAEPAGPTPAHRHHEIGGGARRQIGIPVATKALPETTDEEPETSEDATEPESDGGSED